MSWANYVYSEFSFKSNIDEETRDKIISNLENILEGKAEFLSVYRGSHTYKIERVNYISNIDKEEIDKYLNKVEKYNTVFEHLIIQVYDLDYPTIELIKNREVETITNN